MPAPLPRRFQTARAAMPRAGRLRRLSAPAPAVLGLLLGTGSAMAQTTGIGVISCWGTDAALYKQLPEGCVPSGYFNHGCNAEAQCQTWARIEALVAAYFAQRPSLTGIFFDEATPPAWSCSAFVSEYQKLSALVAKYRAGAQISSNAGVPDNCVVGGALAGETLVRFESSSASASHYSGALQQQFYFQ